MTRRAGRWHLWGHEIAGRASQGFLPELLSPGRADTHHQLGVALNSPARALAIGGRGEAKIAAQPITLARWLVGYFAQTFRLPT